MFPVIDLTKEDNPVPSTSEPSRMHSSGTQQRFWKCQFCTFAYNPLSRDACKICLNLGTMDNGTADRQPSSRDDSVQDSVGQQNGSVDRSTSIESLSASLSRASVQTISANDPSAWTCNRCTWANSSTTSICTACGKSQKTSKPPPQRRSLMEHGSGWACPRCTFVNSACGNVCLVCSRSKSPGIVDKFEGEDVEQLRHIHEQEAIQQWDQIIAVCRRDKTPFVDAQFPAAPGSLAVYNNPPDAFSKTWLDSVRAWLRPSQLKQNRPRSSGADGWTVCRAPAASHIKQGNLGDCWFMCALSVVAEQPGLIFNILLTKEYNKEGAYLIRLCIDGLWKVILVDDLFPADGVGNLVLSNAEQQQLWVPLIEKALAKAHGSYHALTMGRIDEGLMFLTGAPCERLNLWSTYLDAAALVRDYDSMWVRLLSFHSSRFPMGAICELNPALTEQDYLAIGLSTNHCYSILDVSDAGGNRLIRLRNPWGWQAWTGDWSAGSPLWTAALRQQLLPQGAADGLFWISLQDLVKYFNSVDISKYRGHWLEVRVQGMFPKCALHSVWSAWMLSVTETTEVDLTLYQEGYRGAYPEMNHHRLDLALLVFSVTPDGKIIELVAASQRTVFAFVGESVLLDPGYYLCWTMAFNHIGDGNLKEEAFPDNVLAVHSAKLIVVERFPAPPYALADIVISWAVNLGTRWYPMGPLPLNGEGVVAYAVEIGGLIIVFENRHLNQNVQVVCDCSQSREVVSTRGVLVTADVIPALSRCVICIVSPAHSGTCQTHYVTQQRVSDAADEGLGDWGPVGVAHVPDIDTDALRDLHSPRPL